MRLPGRWGRWRNGSRGAADEIRSGPRSPPQSNGRVAGTDVVATEAGSGTRVYRLVQMPGRAAPMVPMPWIATVVSAGVQPYAFTVPMQACATP
jgi:hypothetical protein